MYSGPHPGLTFAAQDQETDGYTVRSYAPSGTIPSKFCDTGQYLSSTGGYRVTPDEFAS
jgi:hypothetical protein